MGKRLQQSARRFKEFTKYLRGLGMHEDPMLSAQMLRVYNKGSNSAISRSRNMSETSNSSTGSA